MPGVLDILFEVPKDAKAPDPSPNAEDAPTVGEATVALEDDVIGLKGLDLPPWTDVSPPKRFAAGKVRGESDLELSRVPLGLEVDSESLLELQPRSQSTPTKAADGKISHFDRRCHKLSIDRSGQNWRY